jgi:hypothetical protein
MKEAGPAPQTHSLAPAPGRLGHGLIGHRPAHGLAGQERAVSSPEQRGYRTATELRAALMVCFWSLPEAVRARAAVNVTPTGHL